MAVSGTDKKERLERVLPWRDMFKEETIAAALASPRLSETVFRRGTSGSLICIFVRERFFRVTFRNFPSAYNDTWKKCTITCTCGLSRCIHVAAALLGREAQFGDIILRETNEEYRERLRRDQEAERERIREALKGKAANEIMPALEAFRDRAMPELVFFDIEKALSSYTTTAYAIVRLPFVRNAAHERHTKDTAEVIERENDDGSPCLVCAAWFTLEKGLYYVEATLSRSVLSIRSGDIVSTFKWYGDQVRWDRNNSEEAPLNEYELAVIALIWDAADQKNSKSITDRWAEALLSGFMKLKEESARKDKIPQETPDEKKPVMVLSPRLIINVTDTPVLSFKIGTAGGKMFVLKSCGDLFSAMSGEKILALGKNDQLDFSTMTVHPDSAALLDFLSGHRSPDFSGGTFELSLNGRVIDGFYDLYDGSAVDFSDKTTNAPDRRLSIGHHQTRFRLTAETMKDARGRLAGVSLTGTLPRCCRGVQYSYILDGMGLTRMTKDERRCYEMFRSAADYHGRISLSIGLERLQEFFYRVLPSLLETGMVDFENKCGDDLWSAMPPEPEFKFYIDMTKDGSPSAFLKGEVAYGEEKFVLAPPDHIGSFAGRDRDQEERVVQTVRRWFPDFDKDTGRFRADVSDDFLYDLLKNGVSDLEPFGEVRGSSAFMSRQVRQQPSIQVSVTVDDGGLMNISLTSKDIPDEELLALYDSYVQKKRYFRLSGGDFIDLTEKGQMDEISALLGEVDLTPTDVLRRNIHIPVYRALYLDRMLEEHNEIAALRDKTYRALVRSFKTVRDAEYETPAPLQNVLRPYQVYGYKWLRTLQSAGFGGILADEMGLGKTVQMISIFQADRDQGCSLPSFVVCPASLVYNWHEEIRRFAPSLTSLPLTGTAAARRAALTGAEKPDVYITSYDLLKRDIALYEDIEFMNCVLDEAQYIKTTTAAVTKSVKLIRARHRFALTGTPIENRLSELWSIFDFLMPGFLFSHTEFERRFASPISKQKDESVTARLKAMTGPFILRRRKSEVLKDLPEKLEEVRMAHLGGEQQKLYDAQVVRIREMLAGSTLKGAERIRILAELTRIRQICCDPSLLFEGYRGESAKREACLDLVESAIEGGHRMLIFSQFVSLLQLLEEDLKKRGIGYYMITGSTPKETRLEYVRAFNEGDTPVFLISQKAGGTGLNLTGADVVIHYDPWWNAAAQNQATDRTHRIGQTKQVTVFKLILKDTIEERILALQNAKADLAEAILEGSGESIMTMSAEELLALLQ